MGIDGISLNRLAKQLNSRLQNHNIDKIQQPNRFDILITFHAPGGPRLLLSANPNYPLAVITREQWQNPAQAPMFCMLLRKHLGGAKLLSVESPNFERLLRFRFSMRDDFGDLAEKCLVVELQGRHSNIILLDHNDFIMDALVHVDSSTSRYREILPARPYVMPPPQHRPLPAERLHELKVSGAADFFAEFADKRLDKALLELCLGLSPQLVQEIIWSAGVDGKVLAASLTEAEQSSVSRSALRMLEQIVQNENNAWVYPEALHNRGDFHVLQLDSLGPREERAGINEAIAEVYGAHLSSDQLGQKQRHLQSIVQKELTRKTKLFEAYSGDMERCQDFERKKKYGELILSQLNQLPNRLPDSKLLTLVDYYSPDQAVLEIELDPRYSVRQNATRLFKQYNKEKDTYAYAREKMLAVQKDIDYLDSIIMHLENSDSTADLDTIRAEIDQTVEKKSHQQQAKKKLKAKKGKKGKPEKARKQSDEVALPPRRYLTSDGIEILAGRNNLQNDRLTLRQASPDDIWLHAKNRPGAHVILRTGGKEIPDQSLLEAAEITAWLSRTTVEKQAGLAASLTIDYCPASHVRKPNGAKPGHVIYEGYHSIQVTPTEHAGLSQDA